MRLGLSVELGLCKVEGLGSPIGNGANDDGKVHCQIVGSRNVQGNLQSNIGLATVVPTKSDSDVVFCLQLLSQTLTCALNLSYANR